MSPTFHIMQKFSITPLLYKHHKAKTPTGQLGRGHTWKNFPRNFSTWRNSGKRHPGKETRGMPLPPLSQRGFPLAQLATLSKLGGRGETEQPLALSAADPISDSWPPPFEKDILLSSKLATGIFHKDESAISLLPACCPWTFCWE